MSARTDSKRPTPKQPYEPPRHAERKIAALGVLFASPLDYGKFRRPTR